MHKTAHHAPTEAHGTVHLYCGNTIDHNDVYAPISLLVSHLSFIRSYGDVVVLCLIEKL